MYSILSCILVAISFASFLCRSWKSLRRLGQTGSATALCCLKNENQREQDETNPQMLCHDVSTKSAFNKMLRTK
jgi:hypothetical protein